MDIRDYVIDININNDDLNIKHDYVLKSEAIKNYKKHEKPRFFCPVCKQHLIGAKGNIKSHYFKHYKIDEQRCESLMFDLNNIDKIKNNINESELHKEVKNIFKICKEMNQTITIPPYYISLNDYDDFNNFKVIPFLDGNKNEYHLEIKEIIKKREVKILEISEEVIQKNDICNFIIIPDLIIKCIDFNSNEIVLYNIEIAVTHSVDSKKFEKIQKNNVNCIQVYGNSLNKIHNLYELDKISKYIYTVEKNVESVYKNIYNNYLEKTQKHNQEYWFNNDLQYIAYNNNRIDILGLFGKCFSCDKRLEYDNKHFIYRHIDIFDFISCQGHQYLNKNLKIMKLINHKQITYFFEYGKYFMDDNVLILFNDFYSINIKSEHIDILKLASLARKQTYINITDFLYLTKEESNLISNYNLLAKKIYKLYNSSIISNNIIKQCPFCFSNNKIHNYKCLTLKKENFEQSLCITLNSILNKELFVKLKQIKEAKILKLDIIANIFYFFKILNIPLNKNNFYFVYDKNRIDIYIKIEVLSFNIDQKLFSTYFKNNTESFYITKQDCSYIQIEYNLFAKNKIIEFLTIEKNIVFFNILYGNFKILIEHFLILKSENFIYLLNVLNKINPNININNIQIKYNKAQKYEILFDNQPFLNIIINNNHYSIEDIIPFMYINYSYNNFNLNLKTILSNTKNNELFWVNFCINNGWLIGEKYLLPNNKYISAITLYKKNSEYLVYNITINNVEHLLYFHYNAKDIDNYSLSINLSVPQYIEDLLFGYNKYIKYNKYSNICSLANKEKQINESQFKSKQKLINNKIYKDNKNKKHEIRNKFKKQNYFTIEEKNNKNQQKSKILIPNHIKKQFLLNFDKLFYVRFIKYSFNINKTQDNSTIILINNDFNIDFLKLKTRKNNILLLPLYLKHISIEENFALFIFDIITNILYKKININDDIYLYNFIKISDLLPDYILCFDKFYNVNFNDKLFISNYFFSDNKFNTKYLFEKHKDLFFAYLIYTGHYPELSQHSNSYIKNLISFKFLKEEDIKKCLKAIK